MESEIEGAKADELDVMVIGGGSAAFAAAVEGGKRGANVTIVNDGLPMGGTCVNVGCVPSKYMLRAGESVASHATPGFRGVECDPSWSFEDLMSEREALVERLQQEKYEDIIQANEAISFTEGTARFLSPEEIDVAGQHHRPDRVIVATGASPSRSEIPGLEAVDYLTTETFYAQRTVPDSVIILGGGYTGLETAQICRRFGAEVTVVDRSEILSGVDRDVADGLGGFLREEGIGLLEGAEPIEVRQREGPDGKSMVELQVASDGGERRLRASDLLVATGRSPNVDRLDASEAGLELNAEGAIRTDCAMRTSVEGVYAAGDVIGDPMFVYTAAREGKQAARHALGATQSSVEYGPIPRVVFTDPQVAVVGMDEEKANQLGYESETTTLSLEDVPRSLVGRDTRGFIKLVRDRQTDELLGGAVLAPEGGELVSQIALAISKDVTVGELTELLHPYLTLSEGVRLAALSFDQAVDALSCCAG